MASAGSSTTRKSLPAPSCLVACITPLSQLVRPNRARPGPPGVRPAPPCCSRPSAPAGRGGTTRPGAGRTGGCAVRLLPARSQGCPGLHVGQNHAIARRLARRPRQAGGPGGRGPDLVHQAVLPPCGRSGFGSRRRSRRAAGRGRPGPCGWIGLEPGPERREGPARPEGDLQGTDNAPAIRGLHPRRTDRVEHGEARVQVARPVPALVQLRLQRGGHLRVAPRDGEVVDNGAQVEPGAADQQRMMPAPGNAFQGGPPACWNSVTVNPRPGRRGRAGGAALRPTPRDRASTSRCPCRGRRTWNRRRRSRSRPGAAPAAGRPPISPRR